MNRRSLSGEFSAFDITQSALSINNDESSVSTSSVTPPNSSIECIEEEHTIPKLHTLSLSPSTSTSSSPNAHSIPSLWEIKADHMTVCLGIAPPPLLQNLNESGSIGSSVHLRAIAVGIIPNRVIAVQVELNTPVGNPTVKSNPISPTIEKSDNFENPPTASVQISKNAIPHVTIAVAVPGVIVKTPPSARESNLITQWIPISTYARLFNDDDSKIINNIISSSENIDYIALNGKLDYKKLVGLKGKEGLNESRQKPKDISIGTLIKKHHPHLQGPSIGKAVAEVESWMERTFIENEEKNASSVESFIVKMSL